MMGNPRDNSIMKKAQGKNKKHLTKKVLETCNTILLVTDSSSFATVSMNLARG